LLFEHVRRNQAPVIHMMPPADPMDVVQYTGGGPPPPPPGAGSIKIKKGTAKKKEPRAIVVKSGGNPPAPPGPEQAPAPEPLPVPTIPTPTPMFDIPKPKPRTRSRSAPRAKQSRVPWTTGLVPEEAMIPTGPPAPPPPPPPRGRARKRAVSTETIRYASEQPQAKAKAKAAPRAVSARAASDATVRYPSEERGVLLPTVEEAEKTGKKLDLVKKKPKAPRMTLKAAKLAEDVGKDPKPKPVAKAKGRPRKIPSAGSQAGKRPVIRKVRIADDTPGEAVLKKRGRPAGSVGKAKRDLLFSNRIAAIM
jgi:hypothetical protein